MNKEQTFKAKIYFYRFDISNKDEKEQYLKTCETAKALSKVSQPDTLHYINFTFESNKAFYDKLMKYDTITIETKFLFKDQFNTKEGFRLWAWRENIFQNKNIKQGYYIEMPEEYLQLLNNTFKCGYCGKQYSKEQHKTLSFCNSCLNSEYLKEDELFLLRLKRINDDSPRLPLNDCDKETLTQAYKESQIYGTSKRGKERLKKKYEEIKSKRDKETKEAETEYKAFKWLLDNKIDLSFIDNCIYYSHTDTFCFGWRNPLNFEQEQKLKENLKGFPFMFEIKIKEVQ